MATKTKSPSSSAGPLLVAGLKIGPSQPPPCTTEDRLQRIEAMSQRINEYVQFMCKVGNLNGTSAESKEKAVVAFYEQMVVLERQLGRIHGELQLG